jgi:hypothetical protein
LIPPLSGCRFWYTARPETTIIGIPGVAVGISRKSIVGVGVRVAVGVRDDEVAEAAGIDVTGLTVGVSKLSGSSVASGVDSIGSTVCSGVEDESVGDGVIVSVGSSVGAGVGVSVEAGRVTSNTIVSVIIDASDEPLSCAAANCITTRRLTLPTNNPNLASSRTTSSYFVILPILS